MTSITEQGSDTILDRVVHTYEGKVLVYQPGPASDIRLTVECDGGVGAHVGNGPFRASVWMEGVAIGELAEALRAVQARRMDTGDAGACSHAGLTGTIEAQNERLVALRAELARAQERIADLELQVDAVLRDRRQVFEDGFRLGFGDGAHLMGQVAERAVDATRDRVSLERMSGCCVRTCAEIGNAIDAVEVKPQNVQLTINTLVLGELANVRSQLEDARQQLKRQGEDLTNLGVQHEVALGFNAQLSLVFNAALAVERVMPAALASVHFSRQEGPGEVDLDPRLARALHVLGLVVRNITHLGGASLAEECVAWAKLWRAGRDLENANNPQATESAAKGVIYAVRSLGWLVPVPSASGGAS